MGEIISGPHGQIWERSSELRIARNFSHVGRPERLQQRWWCRDTGKVEWRDIPVTEDTQ
jgi:hypothetical protein